MAYGSVTFILIHPFLVVLPRFFEAGIDPIDAFVDLVTNFESVGVVAGLVAWVLLLVLTVTAFFRIRIVQGLKTKFPKWPFSRGVEHGDDNVCDHSRN